MKTRNIGIILFILTFCMIATACGEKPQESSSVILTGSILTETTIAESSPVMLLDEKSTEVTTLPVATTATSSTTAVTTESTTDTVTTMSDEKLAEKQLVKEILMIEDPYYPEEHIEEDAEWMVNSAEPFSESALGSIISEEDAKEKGRSVFIKRSGQEYVDELEANFFIRNGKQIKFERDHSPYSVTYYEKYDAWIVKVILPSGKTEDGGWIATPGTPPYVILRGSDGKVLAIF